MESGSGVHAEAQAISRGLHSTLVLGQQVLVRDSSGYSAAKLGDRSAAGVLIGSDGRLSLVPSPPSESGLVAPFVAYDEKTAWDVIWMRRQPVAGTADSLTKLYHAVFDGEDWNHVEVIGELGSVFWGPGITSDLARTPQVLAFAVPLRTPFLGGGVAVLLRRNGRWNRLLVPTGTDVGSAYATIHVAGSVLTLAYATGDASPGGGSNALYVRRSLNDGTSWSLPQRILGSGAHAPRIMSLGPRALVLVWRQVVGASPNEEDEAWLARSGDGGATWAKAEAIPNTKPLNGVVFGTLSDSSAIALVQLGGPLRREHRLFHLSGDATVEIFGDSVDAATHALLSPLGDNEFQAIWSRGERVGGGVVPRSVVRRYALICVRLSK